MMHTDRADHVRRLTGVPLALALALSALLLVSGQALAGKPVPFVGGHGEYCAPPFLDRGEVHGAQFDLSSNKGRWLFVEAQSKVGDAAWSSYVVAPARVETDVFVMRTEGIAPGESSSFRLRLVDRKGAELTTWTEVLDVDC